MMGSKILKLGSEVKCIPFVRSCIEAAGYRGFHEVEIFSAANWWRRDPDEVLAICRERHQSCC